jgi:hypothetical protein
VTTSDRSPRGRKQAAGVAALAAIALLATGVALVAWSPPTAQRPNDIQGRTWLSVRTGDGPALVLVNGISGLIEGEAATAERQSTDLKVVDSSTDRTLLGSSSSLTVVENGSHRAASRADTDGSNAVLLGDQVLTVGRNVELLAADLAGEPSEVATTAEPVTSAPPVVDGQGRAWFLARDDGNLVAQRFDPDDEDAEGDAAVESTDVDDSTTRLLVVDGKPFATGPKGAVGIDGGGEQPAITGADVLPSVAQGTGGVWASADGSDVVVVDGDREQRTRLDHTVTDLVIWQGAVIAFTATGAWRVSEDGQAAPIEPLGSGASAYVDGGLLWLTSDRNVVAVWKDQTQVPFALTAVDVNLCVDTCDPEDISQFLAAQREQRPEPSLPKGGSSTTSPPRELDPPSVEPTVPPTTAPTTTTTEPPPGRRSGTNDTTSTTATSIVPEASSTVPVPPETTPPQPEQPSTPPPDDDDDDDDGPDRPPRDPRPTFPEPPFPTFPPYPDPTFPPTTPEPPPTPPPTPPPGGSNDLVLEVDERQDQSVLATVAVTGANQDCPGAGPGYVDGVLTWSGTVSGSRQVRLAWPTPGGTVAERVPTPALGAGTATIGFEACGKRATRDVTFDGATPTLGDLSFQPAQPTAGSEMTAAVTWSLPDGWTVSSTAWRGGPCGNQAPVDGTAPRQRQKFTVVAGPYCVSVIVTFAPREGPTQDQQKNRQVQVGPTTPTTPPTTPSTPPTTPSTPPTTPSTPPTTPSTPPTTPSTPPTTPSTPPTTPTTPSSPPAAPRSAAQTALPRAAPAVPVAPGSR